MKDSLGDRMKAYEAADTKQLDQNLPIIARMDGRAFHTFTKNMKRPFDARMTNSMIETTAKLVELTNAKIGYTQSDEITLVFYAEENTQVYFAGKLQKMVSSLSVETTLIFQEIAKRWFGDFLVDGYRPVFDARVFQVPTKAEAVNCLIWREQDAIRNSVQMVARSLYSHNECHNKPIPELLKMIDAMGQNYDTYHSKYRRGTYLRKEYELRPYTIIEIESLPAKHAARTNQDLVVQRSVINQIDMPTPMSIVKNREGVIFNLEKPQIWSCMI